MAMIKCKECGKEISDTAKICPNCRSENRNGKIKKQKNINNCRCNYNDFNIF